jgi:hypothetical protein
MTPPKKQFPLLLKVAMGVLGAASLVLLLPGVSSPPVETRSERQQALATATELAHAAQAYREEYGQFPEGDNAAIVTALRGDNPNRTIFFQCPPEALAEHGEIVDPWGTPYAFTFDLPNLKVSVNSAGPNKAFDGHSKHGGDDVSARL